jgi:AcrR family transcriptional regulator
MAKLKPKDDSTEEKIKSAARKVFTQKGFSATRTRDIAEEANINLALLNYYFRSKEKLFDLIMMENMQQFVMAIALVLNNDKYSLNEKVERIAENYIHLLLKNPGLPLFILHEIKANPEKFMATMGVKKILMESHFYKQLKKESKSNINPLHFLINIIGLAVFPFLAGPLLKIIGNMNETEFIKLMEERKKLIPVWVSLMIAKK